jgi:lipoprotein-anchoring transpeptidase ErfK/SrfK
MADPLLSLSPEAVMSSNGAHGVMAAAVAVMALAWIPEVEASGVITTVIATAAPRRVVVSIPDRKLAVIDGSGIVATFDVAVGKPSTPSPVGTFTIVNRIAHPTYYGPARTVAPGPHNPLGTRWMGLSEQGYGIHGTSDPTSIGFARSKGCIRLRNADVERLFDQLRPGDIVELHAERTAEIQQLFPAAAPDVVVAAN